MILVNAERKCLTLVPYPRFSGNFRDKLAKRRRLRRTNLRSGNTSRSDSAWRRSPHESLNSINPRLTSLGFPRNTVLPHIHWIWPFLFRYPGLVESHSEAVSAMRVMFVQPRARGEKQNDAGRHLKMENMVTKVVRAKIDWRREIYQAVVPVSGNPKGLTRAWPGNVWKCKLREGTSDRNIPYSLSQQPRKHSTTLGLLHMPGQYV